MLSDKLTVIFSLPPSLSSFPLINAIKIAMKSLQYASYKGKDLQERQSVSVYLFLQMRATGVYEFAGIKRIFQIEISERYEKGH